MARAAAATSPLCRSRAALRNSRSMSSKGAGDGLGVTAIAISGAVGVGGLFFAGILGAIGKRATKG